MHAGQFIGHLKTRFHIFDYEQKKYEKSDTADGQMFGFAVIVNAYKTSPENTLHALKCRFKAALISVFCCLG